VKILSNVSAQKKIAPSTPSFLLSLLSSNHLYAFISSVVVQSYRSAFFLWRPL
jgi:hypothetical protein